MKLFNTMSRRKEEFVPLEEGKVRMYVCGPTVYNLIHIGNARPMIIFDTVRRYLEYKGDEVNYVSNFTDVDDKIIKKASDHTGIHTPGSPLRKQYNVKLRLSIHSPPLHYPSYRIGRASCRERV